MRPVQLKESGMRLQRCHAAALENSGELYRLYDYGKEARGVFRNGMLVCDSIPKEDEASRFIGLMVFNKNAFEQAKSKHRQYWEWRRTRNEARWRSQEAGVLDYDAKNLMHTFRLLYSALNIIEDGEPLVRFSGEKLQELRDIRSGRFGYDELVAKAEALSERLAAGHRGEAGGDQGKAEILPAGDEAAELQEYAADGLFGFAGRDLPLWMDRDADLYAGGTAAGDRESGG